MSDPDAGDHCEDDSAGTPGTMSERRFEWLVSLGYGLMAVPVAFLISLDLPFVARAPIPLGIAIGVWGTARITGRVGVDVWLTPVLVAMTFGGAVLWWLDAVSLVTMFRVFGLATVAMVTGHLGAVVFALIASRRC